MVGLTAKGKCLGRSNKSGTLLLAMVPGAWGLLLRIEEVILRATSKLVLPRKWKYDQIWIATNKKNVQSREEARCSSVVKALCYKSEGRWFDSRWCHWNFSLT